MTELQKSERVKTRVTFKLTTTMEFDDDGYLGPQATIEEHLKQAREKLANCQILIKQGTAEPKPTQARVELIALSLIPKGD